jgi:hypothetical protein
VTGAVGDGHLYGVTALSANNILVVGSNGNWESAPVIEHFDGTAWHLVAQPVHTYQSVLVSVSAASPSDIWAVGGQNGGTSAPVLVEHYNGTGWTEVPNPAPPPNVAYHGGVGAVAALGSGDVWVVGSAVANSSTTQTLALHFDGTSWQVIPSDNSPATNACRSPSPAPPGASRCGRPAPAPPSKPPPADSTRHRGQRGPSVTRTQVTPRNAEGPGARHHRQAAHG